MSTHQDDFERRLKASETRAKARLAADLAAIDEDEPAIPTTRSGPHLSILASPHLTTYPTDVLDWIRGRTGKDGWTCIERRGDHGNASW